MRILLVNKFWRPLGGVEEHAFLVKKTLEDLGHEVIPFSMSDPDNLPTEHDQYFVPHVDFRTNDTGARVHAVGRAAFGIATVRRIRRVVREQRIDAAHVLHAYHQLGMTFMLELKRLGIPTVLSLHDYKIGCPNYRYFSDRDEKICTKCLDHRTGFLWAPVVTRCWDGSATAGAMLSLEATTNKALGSYRRGPGSVIVLNELQERSVESAGVPSERIYRIPHFLDFENPQPTERVRSALYVGRLVPEKGVGVLIHACAEARLPLTIIGDGRERQALEALAAELRSEVTFAGEQDRAAVQSAMAGHALLAVPSLWHEVSPLVILEAIALGCPVVGSDVGGIPDLIGDGRGTLVPAGDVAAWSTALTELADQPGLGQRLAVAAQLYARAEWTRDRWIERLRDAYARAGAEV